MSEGEKPVPVPRPRQSKADELDTTTSSGKVYENYSLPTGSVYDNLNAQLNELKNDAIHHPVPAPRARGSAAVKREYENSPEAAKPLNNQQNDQSPSKATGAIRKSPNIPSVKNNLDETDHVRSIAHEDFDVLSQTSSTSGKSGGDSKFTTPSPG